MEASGEGLFVKYPQRQKMYPQKNTPSNSALAWDVLERQEAKKPGSYGETGLFGVFLRSLGMLENVFLAERAGFEPAVGINPHTLSRRAT